MPLLTTSEVGQLLGVSAATIKRLSVAGKIACQRGANGIRGFCLEDVAAHLHAEGSLEDALRAGSTEGCVSALLHACLDGMTLAEAFNDVALPAVDRMPSADLSFIERCEPLGAERHGRSASPTAIMLSADAGTARARMAACLLRGLGYRVPALSREAQIEVLRVIACADPTLVVAMEPHRPDLALLREHLPSMLGRIGGSFLVDGAVGGFRTLQEFLAGARIRIGGPRVTPQSIAVS